MFVVGAHRVVGACFAGVEVQALQFLAERGDVLVDHHPQLLQRLALFPLVHLAPAPHQGVRARAARSQHHTGGDQAGDRYAGVRRGAPGRRGRTAHVLERRVDEIVQLGLDVVGVLHRLDQVVHRLVAHDGGVGLGAEAVTAAHRVQAGDAGLRAQVQEEVLLGLVGRENGDEDRLVGVLDLVGERLGVRGRQLVGGGGVHIDGVLAQRLGDRRQIRGRERAGHTSGQHRQRGGDRDEGPAHKAPEQRSPHT